MLKTGFDDLSLSADQFEASLLCVSELHPVLTNDGWKESFTLGNIWTRGGWHR